MTISSLIPLQSVIPLQLLSLGGLGGAAGGGLVMGGSVMGGLVVGLLVLLVEDWKWKDW